MAENTIFARAAAMSAKRTTSIFIIAKDTMIKTMEASPQLLTDLRNGWELCGTYSRGKCVESFKVYDEQIIFELLDECTMITGEEILDDPINTALFFQERFDSSGNTVDYKVKIANRYEDGHETRQSFKGRDAEKLREVLSLHNIEADKSDLIAKLSGKYESRRPITRDRSKATAFRGTL